MFFYLLILFTVIPVIELAFLIKIGQNIGLNNTISIVIITGITGAYLARSQGFKAIRRIESQVNQGNLPADELFNGVIILCSGLLLLTPGFITDSLGFLGLIPASRNFFKKILKKKINDIVNRKGAINITSFKSK
tara:strand:+ start:1795 stop:2199 length:405 start_codon:yes stop_codon:yes gene_type:complete